MAYHDRKQNDVSQIVEELLCKVCDRSFVMGDEMVNHISSDHFTKTTCENNGVPEQMPDLPDVEYLFSCNQCDFDTDKIDQLDKHLLINVHDVQNKNKTLEEIGDDQEEKKRPETD